MNMSDPAEYGPNVSVNSGPLLLKEATRLELHIMFKLVLGCGSYTYIF